MVQKDQIILKILKENFAICRLDSKENLPRWIWNSSFSSVTRTSEELSIVCFEKDVPETVISEKNWRCLKINEILNFSVTGILSSLTKPLADAGICVFVISTFNTDYLLVKAQNLPQTISILRLNGIKIIQDTF